MKKQISYLSDHLLCAVAICFSCGIALSPHIELTSSELHYFFATLLLFALVAAALHYFLTSDVTVCLLLPIFLGIGCYHGYLHLQPPLEENHIFNRIAEKSDCVLIGTMSSMARFDGRTSQVKIEAEFIRFREAEILLPTTGTVQLRFQGPWPYEFSPGDTLIVRTELKRPQSFKTPGVFDYAQYLARKDIWITGFIRSPLFIYEMKETHNLFKKLRYLPEQLRTKIGHFIDSTLSGQSIGLYRALLLGDRSQLTDETLELFKATGTMHILAISGLHMAIIGSILYFVFWTLLSRSETLLLHFTVKKWAALATLPLLVGYGLLAGMNTPVFRALIMGAIAIVAICSNRKKSPSPLLAFAAMVILLVDPLQLFGISFQLSFAAMAGILFVMPTLKKLLGSAKQSATTVPKGMAILNWLLAGLLISFVANLATAPISLYTFNRFSLVGPIANLILEPLICLWSLTAGFLSIPFIFFQPGIAACLLQAGECGLTLALWVADFLSSLSFSTLWLPTPAVWLVICYFFTLVIFILIDWKKKWAAIVPTFLFVLCVVCFFYPLEDFLSGDRDTLRLSYLDVGQGTATLVEYPSGFRLLIDGGGSSFPATTVGERVIGPFLWKKGIRKLDALAITHPDADHYNGLPYIIKHFSPKTLWVRETTGHDSNYKDLIQLARKHQLALSTPKTGVLWSAQEDSLECLANLSNFEKDDITSWAHPGKNSGLVLRVCSQGLCALFPGDIEKREEQTLVDKGIDQRADVLLAAHHGSITSNTNRFLSAVSPQYLLVSAGISASQHFPHKNLAQICQDRQIQLITTAAHGTLQVITHHDGFSIYGQRRKGDNNPLSSFQRILLGKSPFRPR